VQIYNKIQFAQTFFAFIEKFLLKINPHHNFEKLLKPTVTDKFV
jgi:hypothetical protein